MGFELLGDLFSPQLCVSRATKGDCSAVLLLPLVFAGLVLLVPTRIGSVTGATLVRTVASGLGTGSVFRKAQ